jgi:septin family protein
VEYIEKQNDLFIQQESQANFRRNIPDTRVHALLYFIAPTGHRLKALDVAFLTQLASKTNVIPVIAKADTLMPEERQQFKDRVRP